MKFDIINRFTGAVKFSAEIECGTNEVDSVKLGLAVRWAIKSGANLSCANLSYANLSYANLSYANLSRANLGGANLSRADLRGASLSGADLRGASLSGANLRGAYLSGAYLSGANLRGASLCGANLSGASLGGGDWIVQGATRSDGYQFLLTNLAKEGIRIKAGCRNFSIEEANAHWGHTRAGTPLGDETFEIINSMYGIAFHRGLIDANAQPIISSQA